MKKTLLTVALLAAFGVARADILQDANNSVGLSVGLSHLDYVEHDSRNQNGGKTLDSENGNQFALQASVVRDGSIGPLDNIYTSLSFSAAVGPVNYNGYHLDMSTTTGLGAPMSFSHNPSSFDVAVKVGKTFRLHPQFRLTPYVSYDYHHWNRFTVEQYDHHEIGGGVLAQYAINDKFMVGLDVNVAEVIGAQCHPTGLKTESLGSKPTIGVTLSGEYAVTKKLHLTASYNYRHFQYGQSEGSQVGTYQGQYSTGWFEPASTTNTHTVMVGAKYVF